MISIVVMSVVMISTLCELTSKRQGAKVLGHGAKDGYRQEQQRTHQEIVPSSTKPKVKVSVRKVPTVKGLVSSWPGWRQKPWSDHRHKSSQSITRPQAMSQGDSASAGCFIEQTKLSFSPSKPEPLLAEAEVNS